MSTARRGFSESPWLGKGGGLRKIKPTHVTVTKRSKLREPHERPPSMSLPKEAPASWWCGLSRAEFTATIDAKRYFMGSSRIASSINPTWREQWA